MIIHGKKTLNRSEYSVDIEVVRGYYLICDDKYANEIRIWMGETFEQAFRNFDKVGDKHLKDFNKYQYWIDYCSGYDVDRKLAWSNLDQTERFIDHGTF
ncbi:hypothetical protein D3C85_794180 [compost metagenome]